jgi:hypothetical protein
MPLLEKYKWYQCGIVKAGTNERMQRFFKTNPSEEQLLILDEMDKINNFIILLGVLLYFVLGVLVGYLIFYFPSIIVKLVK